MSRSLSRRALETFTRLRYPNHNGPLNAYKTNNFLNGPGKLCKALSLDTSYNSIDLTGNTLYVVRSGEIPDTIHASPRIGIDYAEEAVHFPWRFYI